MHPAGGEHKYDDIIHLPHHVSNKRAPMSMTDRGAQFSPFAALTGYDAAIRETARLTDMPVELTESSQAALDETLRRIARSPDTQPEVSVTYFRPDDRKAGGAYITQTGRVKKVDGYGKRILFTDGTAVCFDRILIIECPEDTAPTV